MKKIYLILILVFVLSLSGCCAHEWVEADCVTPKTCSECNETSGEPLGHNAPELTCTAGATCIRCNSFVDAPGHTLIGATCVDPDKCSVCGELFGEALGHRWNDATCTNPITCSGCDETQGEPLGHVWTDADCTTPKTCSACNDTEGEALGHDAPGLTCTTDGACNRCKENVVAPGHSMKDATCTEPLTCAACGLIDGEPLGHTTVNGLCSRCNTEHYEEGMAPMHHDHSHFESMTYTEAMAELENAGFKNITLEVLYDLDTGWLDSIFIDDIETISLDGNLEFEGGGVYADDVPIIIVYHSLTIHDPSIQFTPITVAKLVDEIETNAMRAKETYEGTFVEITGRVENIDSSGRDFYLYNSSDRWALIGVECNTLTDEQKEYLMNLSTDDIITVRGKLTNVTEYGCDLDIYSFK